MKRLQNKTNVLAPNANFPYGNIRDIAGVVQGTPVDVETYADFHQFFERMFALSGLTANGLPDNATNGFQLFESFLVARDLSRHVLVTGGVGSFASEVTIISGNFARWDLRAVTTEVNLSASPGQTIVSFDLPKGVEHIIMPMLAGGFPSLVVNSTNAGSNPPLIAEGVTANDSPYVPTLGKPIRLLRLDTNIFISQ